MNFFVARFVGVIGLVAILFSLVLTIVKLNESSGYSELLLISEVGWGGTAASSSDEFIELFNPGGQPVDLTDWKLNATDGTPEIALSGVVPAYGFFLLERTNDETVSGVAADQIYSGSLSNSSETLELRDESGALIDSANADGGSWPAGTGSPEHRSMERVAPEAGAGWQSNDGSKINGQDADGNPLNATAKSENVGWGQVRPDSAELSLALTQTLLPFLTITNTGSLAAENLTITATLAGGLNFVDSSMGTPIQPTPNRYVWEVDDLAANSSVTHQMNLSVDDIGYYTMTVEVGTTITETNPFDNTATLSHLSGNPVLLNAVHYDAYNGEEAVELVNIGLNDVPIGGWRVKDSPSQTGAAVPADTMLASGQKVWLTRDGGAFARAFGFSADFANLAGTWPTLNDNGDAVLLYGANDTLQDTLVYRSGATTTVGWSGATVVPFRGSSFPLDGQILYRRQDQQTGLPVPDTNTEADWAQSAVDPHSGRKVRYPGWDLDQFFFTPQFTEAAVLTVGISPDNSFDLVKSVIDSAEASLKISVLHLTNAKLADALIAAVGRGVAVDLLMEGSPPGGMEDDVRYHCQRIESAGGNCWFMINETATSIPIDQRIYDRYGFLHAKYILIDDERVLISSDNFTERSMPFDDKANGTSGRRGVVLVTGAPSVVEHVLGVWSADFDPTNHADILPFTIDHPLFGNKYGAPPDGYLPDPTIDGIIYTVRYTEPATFVGTFPFEVVQSPETSLRDVDSLLGLLNRAGAGDTIYVQQLDERPYWGMSTSNPIDDPNPRLEAMLAAARRGADVWLLLDQYHVEQFYDPDDPTSNPATCGRVNAIARAEKLSLRCQLANPTDLGIHNKMVLVEIDGKGYVHVGSINGTEQSSKGNREIALQVQSDEVYQLLAEMFIGDYPHRVFLPFMGNQTIGRAQYPLISEVLYNSTGDDLAEFVEIVNPTNAPIDLSGWSIGDAATTADFEDVRHFPDGTVLQSRQTLVVALNGTAFQAEFSPPNDLLLFEIVDSDPDVPNMIDNPDFDPAAVFALGNAGDEVFLRNPSGGIVDVVAYGTGQHPSVISAPPVNGANRSLERRPYDIDTDNCANDFFAADPSPGRLP